MASLHDLAPAEILGGRRTADRRHVDERRRKEPGSEHAPRQTSMQLLRAYGFQLPPGDPWVAAVGEQLVERARHREAKHLFDVKGVVECLGRRPRIDEHANVCAVVRGGTYAARLTGRVEARLRRRPIARGEDQQSRNDRNPHDEEHSPDRALHPILTAQTHRRSPAFQLFDGRATRVPMEDGLSGLEIGRIKRAAGVEARDIADGRDPESY